MQVMKNQTVKINWPDKAALLGMLWAMPLTEVGRKLGLNRSAVRKMAQQLGLPTPGLGYWQNKKAHLSAALKQQPDKGV
jgi:hypothetical protein